MSDRNNPRGGVRPLALILTLVALALLAGAIFGAIVLLTGSGGGDGSGKPVTVVIEKGADSSQIVDELVSKGVATNAIVFRLRLKMDGAGGRFKPGTYELATGMDYTAVVAALEEGPQAAYVTVTIPEGFTARQIAERMHAKLGLSASDFEKLALTGADRFKAAHTFLKDADTGSLEGYLFPKTYQVRKGAQVSEVIDMMLTQFGKETDDLSYSYATSRGLNLHDVVTIASIAEREAVLPKQQPLVASVVYNRLDINMYLGMDSVLGYVLGQKVWYSSKDLQADSPYNTYKHKGLPPGPIASPGLSALKAAAEPNRTRYMYFVGTDKQGTLTFTVTYADFLKAKAVSKRVLGQ